MSNKLVDFNVEIRGYEVADLFKDTIWATYVDDMSDEEPDGDGFVMRGKIAIPASHNKNFYRVAQVIKAGPECAESVKEGAYLLIPPQVGLLGIKHESRNTFFIQESKVMAVLSKKPSSK